ncbi:MAG: DUF6600 domain-containing protein, partial [Luteitalea sp.]
MDRWSGSRSLVLAASLVVPTILAAQPTDRTEVPSEPPPHVVRMEGGAATATRDGSPESLEVGGPLLYGDRLDTGDALLQVLWTDGTRIGLDRGTRLDVLSPDLLALTLGRAVIIRPTRTDTAALRLDTPAASLTLTPAGEYRISLEGSATTLAVVSGRADVESGMGTRTITAGQQIAVRDGLAPGAPQRYNAAAYDSFHQWATAPLPALAAGAPRDTFADPRLEAYTDVFNRDGSWDTDTQYGSVWYPDVGNDWRPYSDGRWQALGGYGWTWVGGGSGWAWPTHHYGRWGQNPRGRWFWMPGNQWSPGWVSWSVGPGYIGWSPLGYRDQPLSSWDALSRRRGIYAAGTLDPYRAWTVVPSDRFGSRGRIGAYAVDPRTLDNLQAFVTQRSAPPVGYGVPRRGLYGTGPGRAGDGTVGERPGRGPSSGYSYGAPSPRSGGGSRTGDDTTRDLRRGPGPTRVDPERPVYRPRPSAAPGDPYDRAERVATPRGRQRGPANDGRSDGPPPAGPRQRAP